MRALSIRQPWAWLIVAGFKLVENRTQRTLIRGEFLIHVGRALDTDAHDALMAGRHPVSGEASKLRLLYPPARGESFQLGGFIGVAEITGSVTQHDSEWFTGPHGWLVANARPIRFQPYPGQLGWFTPEKAINTQTEGVPEGQGSLL
jgi:hypothetical protein